MHRERVWCRQTDRQSGHLGVLRYKRKGNKMYTYIHVNHLVAHPQDAGCRRHAYMPYMQTTQVSMCASYSDSHICTRVCMFVPALRTPAVIPVALAASHIRACMQQDADRAVGATLPSARRKRIQRSRHNCRRT